MVVPTRSSRLWADWLGLRGCAPFGVGWCPRVCMDGSHGMSPAGSLRAQFAVDRAKPCGHRSLVLASGDATEER